ncbi:hypothetical protein BZA70DRAFT_274247 [Myxozyma melibiosi]|uniref:RRM domain-containing protein n=1 Tax=Myxozyma melibiosi TaxID=54550 RepID=A0ABR1FFI9_9ASCO
MSRHSPVYPPPARYRSPPPEGDRRDRDRDRSSHPAPAHDGPRTVILSNLPPDEQIDLALLHSLIRGGKIEYSHYDPHRRTFFVHFMFPKDAAAYMGWVASQGSMYINEYEIFLDLVHSPAPVPGIFLSQSNVSRKLYLGGIPPDIHARRLCTMFERYGVIEYVKIVWERKCGWVSFCRMADAFDALRFIRQDEPVFRRSRVEYGRDDCDGGMQEILEGGGVSINARKDVDITIGRFKHLGRRESAAPPNVTMEIPVRDHGARSPQPALLPPSGYNSRSEIRA